MKNENTTTTIREEYDVFGWNKEQKCYTMIHLGVPFRSATSAELWYKNWKKNFGGYNDRFDLKKAVQIRKRTVITTHTEWEEEVAL